MVHQVADVRDYFKGSCVAPGRVRCPVLFGTTYCLPARATLAGGLFGVPILSFAHIRSLSRATAGCVMERAVYAPYGVNPVLWWVLVLDGPVMERQEIRFCYWKRSIGPHMGDRTYGPTGKGPSRWFPTRLSSWRPDTPVCDR